MKTEQHQISENHAYYTDCDRICLLTKNLYNKTLFDLRQIYFHNQKVYRDGKGKKQSYLSWHAYVKKHRQHADFLALGSGRLATQTVKRAFTNWSAFWKALSAWSQHPDRFKSRPIPDYKDPKSGRFLAIFERQAVSNKWKEGIIKLTTTNWELPFQNKDCNKLCEVRIIPRLGYYIVEIVYEDVITGVVPGGTRIAAIDPGLNNLATVVATKVPRALIVNGRPAKAINAYYNKQVAEAKSLLPSGVYNSKRINRMLRRRANKIKDYCHKASTGLVNSLYVVGVNRIVMGHNKGQKQNINLGKRTNQNFVMLPRTMFNSMVKYKAEANGMIYRETEESYTSKTSAIDLDFLPTIGCKPKKWKPSGKRVKRGLYKSKDGTLINADVNGAVNILRKVIRNEPCSDWIKGLAVTPARLFISP